MRQQDESESEFRGSIPPRSIFYSVKAMVHDAPMVESLTGYLRRLAKAHGVSVVDLICHEHFDDLFPASADRRTRRHSFLAEAYQLNGSESFGQNWINRIEAGTAQSDLRYLTLFPFVGATHGSWLRRRRAWCSRCLMEWSLGSQEPYDPLIWSIRLVSVCPIDFSSISQLCPHCGESATTFGGIPFPGFCGWCRRELWEDKRAGPAAPGLPDKYAIWCASEMLSVIGALREFTMPLARGSLAHVLATKVASVGNVSLAEKLAGAGCSKRSSYLWADAATVPRVESLFKLCFHLDLRPVDLLREALELSGWAEAEQNSDSNDLTSYVQLQGVCLSGSAELSGQTLFVFEPENAGGMNPQSCMEVCAPRSHLAPVPQPAWSATLQMGLPFPETPSRKRVRYEKHARRCQIRARLEAALLSEPPPTLNVVAVSLGMSSSTQLREIEPELSRQLTELCQTWREKEEAAIRDAFESPIDSTKPVSLETFCKNHGISYSVIRHRYPDLKVEYTARFRILRKNSRDARSTARATAIARAVNKIRRSGDYPSVARVRSMVPDLKSAGWDKIQEGIRSAIQISKQKEEEKR